MNQDHSAAFDAEETKILSQLVVEDDAPVIEAAPSLPESTPTPEAPPTAAPATPEPVTAAVPPTEVKPEPPKGDTRAALRAARNAEQRLRGEVERLRSENETLKQHQPVNDTQVSDAELAQLEEDFPLQAKIVRRQRELEDQLNRTARVAPREPVEFEPLGYDAPVQDAIDSVPDLLAWQYDPTAQDKFARAIDYDKALLADPDWKGRDITERFAEAARRTNAAFKVATTHSAAAAATTRLDPAQVIAAAPVEGPKGISDFRGGAPANTSTTNYSQMSDEAIMASLPSY